MADYNVNVKVKEEGASEAKRKIADLGKEIQNTGKSGSILGNAASDVTGKLASMGGEAGAVAGRLAGLASTLGPVGIAIGLVGAAVAAVGGPLVAMASAAIDAADKLNAMSLRLNISTERLSLLEAAAHLANSSLNEITGASERLSLKLAKQDDDTGKAVAAITKLGVATKTASGEQKSSLQVMEDIIVAADNAKNKHEAEALAVQALGKDYYNLRAAVLDIKQSKGELYDLMRSTGAIVTDELAKKSDNLKDTVDKVGVAFRGMGNSLAEAAIPVLQKVAGAVLEVAVVFAQTMARITGTEPKSAAIKREIAGLDSAPLSFETQKKLVAPDRKIYNWMAQKEDSVISFIENRDKMNELRKSVGAPLDVREMLDGKKTDTFSRPIGAFAQGVNTTIDTAVSQEMAARKQRQFELMRQLDAAQGEEEAKKMEYLNGRPGEGPGTGSTNTTKGPKDPLAWMKEPAYAAALHKAQGIANNKNREYDAASKAGQDNVVDMYEKQHKALVKLAESTEKYNEILAKQSKAADDYAKNIDDEHASLTMTRRDLNEMQALRQLEIDHLETLAKLHKDGLLTQERETELMLDNARARERIAEKTRMAKEGDQDWIGGVKSALTTYQNEAEEKFSAARDVATRSFKSMEDGLVEFATTGKLNFKDMARSIIADIIRIQMRAAISGVFKLVMGAMGAGSGPATGADMDIASVGQDAVYGRAAGGPVVGGKTYMVGEGGPELVRMGRDAQVVPNHQLGGGGMTIGSISIVVQGGNTNEDTAAAIKKEMLSTMKQIADGRIANAKRSGGLLTT